MAFTLNRLGALILTINRFAFPKATEGHNKYVNGEFFNKYQETLNNYHARIFQIFQEILVILTAGATNKKELDLIGQEQPNLSQPGKGILTFDFTLKRFQASENGLKYFDAFPREGARVYNSIAQALANNTFTALTFDSERFDPYNMHDNATNNSRITITRSGRYNIGACITFDANVGGTIRDLYIMINGATAIAGQSGFNGLLTNPLINVATDYELVVGDYVEAFAIQDSGGALNVNAIGNYTPEFWCCRIHDQPV